MQRACKKLAQPVALGVHQGRRTRRAAFGAVAAAGARFAPSPSLSPEVVTVHFVDPNKGALPRRQTIRAPVGMSVVDVAKANGIEIPACCGQKGQCGTCHVILKKEFCDQLPKPGNRETDILDTTYSLTETSRLGCKVSLTKGMDGIEVTLPDSNTEGLVRMSLDEPPPKVGGEQRTSVPAVFTRPKTAKPKVMVLTGLATRPGEAGPRELMPGLTSSGQAAAAEAETLQRLRDRERDLQGHVARLEVELRQLHRGAAADGAARGSDSKAASSKDKDEDDSKLEKIKKELESTRLDPARMGRSVGFDHVIGLEQAKRALLESVVWPMVADEALFSGVRSSHGGLLLYGPPGCGKTMLARAAAAELGEKVSFFHVRPGDVMSKFYGDSAKRVQALEELVRESAPAVVFFDEVDSLLGSRDGAGVQEHHRATTNALLDWMDGFSKGDERVFFLAATNRAEAIDEAALRRFGDAAEVEHPGRQARLALLRRLALVKADADGHRAALGEDDLEAIADRTQGFSLADLDRLVRRAFVAVLREVGVRPGLRPSEVPPVTIQHFEAALSDGGSTSALRAMLRERGQSRERL